MIVLGGPTYVYWQRKTKSSLPTKTWKPGRNSTLVSKHSKCCAPIEGGNTWAKNSVSTSPRKERNADLPCMTHHNIMECPNALTEHSWNGHEHCCTPVSFLKTFGEKPLLTLFG